MTPARARGLIEVFDEARSRTTAIRDNARASIPQNGKGMARLVSSDDTRHCSSCGHAVTLRLDRSTVAHKPGTGHCPGSGKLPAADVPLVCWLPVRDGLTPYGLRHSHKTWMAEDGIPRTR